MYAILGAVRQNEDMMYDERERVLFFASAMHNDMAAVSATTERSTRTASLLTHLSLIAVFRRINS